MKFLGLIRANLFRKKIRFILTIGSFAVALFLFGILAVVRVAFSGGVDIAGADRLVIINRTSIIQPLPLAYADKIRRIPGSKNSRTPIGLAASIRTNGISFPSSQWTWITGAASIRNLIFLKSNGRTM